MKYHVSLVTFKVAVVVESPKSVQPNGRARVDNDEPTKTPTTLVVLLPLVLMVSVPAPGEL